MGGFEIMTKSLAAMRAKSRAYVLAHFYRITPEMYAALLAFQGYVCAGCGISACPTGKALGVDHDHDCCPYPEDGSRSPRACGKCVRGILCLPCNMTDALAGAPHVDWAVIMEAARTRPTPEPIELMTLREALAAGVLPWTYDAAKQRLQRRVGAIPAPRGKRWKAHLYSREDLARWVESANAESK